MDSGYSEVPSPGWIYRNEARSQEFLSKQVNERLAALMSARFLRLGVRPNTVTALGLVVHAMTAGVVFALPVQSMVPAALVCFCGWQLADDAISPEWAALGAVTSAGWFAAVYNQAMAGPDGVRAGILQRRVGGDNLLLGVVTQGRHLLDTSLVFSVLALAMALDGNLLLGAFLITAAVRVIFIAAKFLAVLVVGPEAEGSRRREDSID